jgi:hypothetical protein
VMDGGGFESVPAAQVTAHALHDVEPAAVLNVPVAHSVQTVWVVAVPGPVVVVPAGQMICGVQVALFSVEANVPVAHAVQVRSVVAVPGEVTEVPTTH